MDLYKAKHSVKKFDRYAKSNPTNTTENNSPSHSYRNSRDVRPSRDRYFRDNNNTKMHTVTCSDCGDKCQIPFEPKFNRPVYCSKCFQKNKQKGSDNMYPRDDRSSPNFSDFKTDKPKKAKFLKKTQSFYSNGSEKFYASLKEKLFEILGGKKCSNCGFNDERALGFNHIEDEDAFDSIRRGGFASSWGKYISEPELARKDLRVLCLNCNETRQPMTKTGPEKSKTLQKKSRYFPR
jgi:CxxC-x17-CxxC domain-containing protein